MSFLDNYGGGGDPLEILRKALMGDSAPLDMKTQMMEAQDIGNQFRSRLPETPIDQSPVPGAPAYRGVRMASADPSFMPEMPPEPPVSPRGSGVAPTAEDARLFPGQERGPTDTLRVAVAGEGPGVAGLTTGPRSPASAPPPGPGATVDQNGSTTPIPDAAPLPRPRPTGFPERNLSVPVGPGGGQPGMPGVQGMPPAAANPQVTGLLGGLIPRDTLAAIARGLSGIKGNSPAAAFARAAGTAYSGRVNEATTSADKARKQSMEDREQRRKEGDSASLRSYRARRAASGGVEDDTAAEDTDVLGLGAKGKGGRGRSMLDQYNTLRTRMDKALATHQKGLARLKAEGASDAEIAAEKKRFDESESRQDDVRLSQALRSRLGLAKPGAPAAPASPAEGNRARPPTDSDRGIVDKLRARGVPDDKIRKALEDDGVDATPFFK